MKTKLQFLFNDLYEYTMGCIGGEGEQLEAIKEKYLKLIAEENSGPDLADALQHIKDMVSVGDSAKAIGNYANEVLAQDILSKRGGCDDPATYDNVFEKLHSNGFSIVPSDENSGVFEMWRKKDGGEYSETVEVDKDNETVFCSVYGIFFHYEDEQGIDYEEFITRG